MAIQSYSRFGFSGHSGTAISNTVQVLACTTTAGMPSAVAFPNSCTVNSIEVQGTQDGAIGNLTVFLARDALGKFPLTNTTSQAMTAGATGVNDLGTRFDLGDVDVHFDTNSGVANTIYVVIVTADAQTLSSGTAFIRVNWRA